MVKMLSLPASWALAVSELSLVVFPPVPWPVLHLTPGLWFGECFDLKLSSPWQYLELRDPSVLKGKMNGLFRTC